MNNVWILQKDNSTVLGVFATRDAARAAKRYMFESSRAEGSSIYKRPLYR